MPPRCLEKGQLSSRIMREVLQSGGRAGDGRTCREGGMWGEHAGGAISRTTWPHASKARGHITPGGRRPDPTHNPRYPVHTTRTPPRAAWRRGAAGDAHSLVAATRAHGEASALHPRRDHPLRASLRKLGGDACLAAPLVCGHAAARCGLHVRGGWCLQASLPARSAGRAKRDVTANTRSAQTGRCLRAGRRPPPSGVPPFEGGSMTSKGCHCEYAECPYSIRLTPTGYTPPKSEHNACPHGRAPAHAPG